MSKMKSKTFVGRENKLKLQEHYFEETIKNKKGIVIFLTGGNRYWQTDA